LGSIESSAPESSLSSVKQALLALQAARKQLEAVEKEKFEPIAIVGMGCRLPGDINSPQAFWNLLASGEETIAKIPESRWNSRAYYSPNYDDAGKIITEQGSFFAQVQESDPEFFGISPREAKSMDPQQHLLLEVCWESLENAKIIPETLEGTKTGVFIGICNQDYSLLSMSRAKQDIDAYMTTGMAHSVAAGRLSYTLGLEGPCLAIDTACSSSLVSVHLACQSLRQKECDLAIAGGVNLILSPETSIDFSRNRMLSPDGRCKAFSAEANGFGRGEGCGLIVLKRLSDVDTTRDQVLALIRGSATNQDGSSSGLTAPNGPSQQRVIQDALKNANLSADQIDYIEAHGTGTKLGDPIEIGALDGVFSSTRSAARPLYIGSVKTNVGHLEGAAGIIGLLKVVLALQHKVYPAHLHCSTKNPHISWNQLPIEILHRQKNWLAENKSRLAGVSSFGFSGTNSHIILEEAPIASRSDAAADLSIQRGMQILNISGRSTKALREQAQRFGVQLGDISDQECNEFCCAASVDRQHFEHRASIVGKGRQDLIKKINAFLQNEINESIQIGKLSLNGRAPSVAWLFTGQGSQYIEMGKSLFENEPVFRTAIEKCALHLDPILQRPLVELIFGTDASALNQTLYTQPALFALEYSLAQLWLSWGVRPDVVAGHSVGEYVAACIAGVFSLEDGLSLISTRARLMQNLKETGAMVAVFTAASEIQSILDSLNLSQSIDIAGVNTPRETVVSGGAEAMKTLLLKLDTSGIAYRELTVSHAFHSSLMEPMLDDFFKFAKTISFQPPTIPLLSNVTGAVTQRDMQSAGYWREQIRKPVQFLKIIHYLAEQKIDVLMEIGPQPILLGMVAQTGLTHPFTLIPSLRKKKSAADSMTENLAKLQVTGVQIDWSTFYGAQSVTSITLPTYPFQRKRHWYNASSTSSSIEQTRMTKLLELIEEGDPKNVRSYLKSRGQFKEQDELLLDKVSQILIDSNHSDMKTSLDVFYKPIWLEQRFSDSSKAQAPETIRFLTFVSQLDEIPSNLSNEFDASCIYVAPGDHYEQKSDALWLINEREELDYTKVIENITQKRGLTGILFIWPSQLNDKHVHPFFGEQLFSHVAHVVTALTKLQVHVPLSFLVKTIEGSYTTEFSRPFSSMMNGFARSLFLENPKLKGSVIEFDELGSTQLLRELLSNVKEDQIRLIGQRRYVARLVRQNADSVKRQLNFAKDATYIITGGLGALGIHATRFLASKNAREIILLGRHTPTVDVQKTLQQIEETGTRVIFLQCDVTQASDVKKAFEYLNKNKSSVKGVIHAAGLATAALCKDLTPQLLHEVLASKVIGSWNLHEQTKDLDLDFFLLYSSISSITGSVELAHYSAANSFMDGLAAYRRLNDLPGISINWGPWDSGGLVKSTTGSEKVFSSGMLLLKPDDATVYLEQALLLNQSQIAVVNADWERVKQIYSARTVQFLFDSLVTGAIETQAESKGLLLRELTALPSWSRADALTEYLKLQVCQLLEIDDVLNLDPQRGFFDMGMDSLGAVALRSRIEQQLSCELAPSTIFDFPSIELLTHRLLEMSFADVNSLSDSKRGDAPTQSSVPVSVVGNPVADLSEDELMALIDGELTSLITRKESK